MSDIEKRSPLREKTQEDDGLAIHGECLIDKTDGDSLFHKPKFVFVGDRTQVDGNRKQTAGVSLCRFAPTLDIHTLP